MNAHESSSRIALLGASGATGRHLLDVAESRGIDVTAIVRDAARLPDLGPDVRVVECELSDTETLVSAFEDVRAVLSTLGVSRNSPDLMPSRHLPSILAAMQQAGVERYVGISGAGLTLEGEHKDVMGRFMSWLVRKLSPVVFEDKAQEYRALKEASLKWTLVRAPRLVDGPPTGKVETGDSKPPAIKVTRGDISAFMLDQVDSPSSLRRAPMVGTAA